jgi:CheY-like chemotaxis protein
MQKDNPNIFYTDDDVDDQDLFRDALAEVDDSLVLTTASDGDVLLSLLSSPPPRPRLIFLDLNMPRKNGYEVLKEIRASEDMRNYPVIVFSTSTDEATIATARKMGADRFISKPRTYDGIKKALKACIGTDWNADRFCADSDYLLRVS